MSRMAPIATSGATTIAMNRKPVYRWKYGTDASMGIASGSGGVFRMNSAAISADEAMMTDADEVSLRSV
jgi:hypothetical protein